MLISIFSEIDGDVVAAMVDVGAGAGSGAFAGAGLGAAAGAGAGAGVGAAGLGLGKVDAIAFFCGFGAFSATFVEVEFAAI